MAKQGNEREGASGVVHKTACSTGIRKEKGQKRLGGRTRKGSRKEREAARYGGGDAGVRRYHGRLQGRRLLGWAYETVFVVALWLRQENR